MNCVAIVRDSLLLLHSNGPGHPESPYRLGVIDTMLERFPARASLVDVAPRDATREEIERVHDAAYVNAVEETRGGPRVMLDPDTCSGGATPAAAVRAAGAAIAAVEAVMRGGFAASFAFVRPPGHHAERDRAMGFCLYNNVAVAAEHALRRLGLERVLVFDWDVHHGNGTMHSFYDTDRVLYACVHQWPLYPGTGRVEETGSGAGTGHTVNVPLPPGQGDEEYAAVVEGVLRPVARQYRPQMVLVSAGFDIARGDPLADTEVTPQGFARMTASLMDMCAESCPGRLVFLLEGGYALDGLAHGVAAVLQALVSGAAEGPGARAPSPAAETANVIRAVKDRLGQHWRFDD